MNAPRSSPRRPDPRPYQIAVLSSLVLYATGVLDFEIRPDVAAAAVVTALATQWGLRRWTLSRWTGHGLSLQSACISSLSLILLLRASSPWLAAATALVAIGSKFVLRFGGRHVFNPTAFALTVMALLCDGVWISPGQWGTVALFTFFVAAAGTLVIHRAERADVTFAFLGAYATLVLGRAAWLGDPWSIPLHQLESGALLVFSFFMISDPRTTPASRAGRVLFAALVAAIAAVVQFVFFRANGPIYGLVLCAPLVPLIDRLLPGEVYTWPSAPSPIESTPEPALSEPSKEVSPCTA